MSLPDAVSRRLVEGIHKRELDSVVERGIMSRPTALDCLIAADGDLGLVNRLWKAWRQGFESPQRMQRIAGMPMLEADLVAYVRAFCIAKGKAE
jgi:hypothetical protein